MLKLAMYNSTFMILTFLWASAAGMGSWAAVSAEVPPRCASSLGFLCLVMFSTSEGVVEATFCALPRGLSQYNWWLSHSQQESQHLDLPSGVTSLASRLFGLVLQWEASHGSYYTRSCGSLGSSSDRNEKKQKQTKKLTKVRSSVLSVTGFSWSVVDLHPLNHSWDPLFLDERLSQLQIPFAAPEGLRNVFLSLQCGSSRSKNPKGWILTLIPDVLHCTMVGAGERNLHFRHVKLKVRSLGNKTKMAFQV